MNGWRQINEIRLFRMARDSIRFGQCFKYFPKYINWILRDFLDEFCSVYVDDILIYTDDCRAENQKQITFLKRLRETGLQLNVNKYEFEVKTTKYLGSIIEINKNIIMDPTKIEIIIKWEALKTVKGVQKFLGFANFYRKFNKNFSQLVTLLTNLVKNDTIFFSKLTQIFVTVFFIDSIR